MSANKFLDPEQLEKFKNLREIDTAVCAELKKGGLRFKKKGNRRMPDYFTRLFNVLIAMNEGSDSRPHKFICVYDKPVELFDFSSCDGATELLMHEDNFAIFSLSFAPNDDGSEDFELVYGREDILGEVFTLLPTQFHLPEYFDEDSASEIADIIRISYDGERESEDKVDEGPAPGEIEVTEGLSLEPRKRGTKGSTSTRVQPQSGPTEDTRKKLKSLRKKFRAQSLALAASQAGVCQVQGSSPGQADALLAMCNKLLDSQSLMLQSNTALQVATATVVNVVAAQSESKRQDLPRVNAIKGLFDSANFNRAWQVLDYDASGKPAAFNMVRAAE